MYAAMRLAPDAQINPQLPINLGAGPLSGGCCEARLYPPGYGWTTVNYPAGSFLLLAQLRRVTHDLLFTGRSLSLLGLAASCVLAGAAVRLLGGTRRAGVLSGALLLSIFCLCAPEYVGMDDPQMLGQAISLLGLLVYLRMRGVSLQSSANSMRAYAGLILAAALFVMAGCIKQNLLAFPLAALIDLVLLARVRALWVGACGLALAALALRWNAWMGGPWFVQEMLLPRSYSGVKAALMLRDVFGPLLLPFVVASWAGWRLRHDPVRRVVGIALAMALLIGGYFSGGAGVARNAFFDAFCATAMLLGLAISEAEGGFSFRDAGVQTRSKEVSPKLALLVPALCLWMTIPALVSGTWNAWRGLREAFAAQRRFQLEAAFLRAHPGPALCESLLLCADSGKPFVYDPFNATRLVHLGKLNPEDVVREVRQRRYAAVQMRLPPPGDALLQERFPAEVLQAVAANYVVALRNEDGVILEPAP